MDKQRGEIRAELTNLPVPRRGITNLNSMSESISRNNGSNDSLEGTFRSPIVVGIGASAGGVQALQEFFKHVPVDSGMAYAVILHLSPSFDSKLTEILQYVSRIPVNLVTEKVK
jgi:chemotaxis response regulator CheB